MRERRKVERGGRICWRPDVREEEGSKGDSRRGKKTKKGKGGEDGREGEQIWEWPVLGGGRGKCTRWRPMLPTTVTQQLDKVKVTGR